MSTQRYYSLGNRTMALSGLTMLVGVGAAYPFAAHFGLGLQIVAHLAITIAAGFFKLGYVLRLAAQHEQARRAPSAPPQRQVLATV
ncbi:MAG: hypothetical protein KIT35_15605 [Piscinibacter sp.]|uniref:hypothetical protein n=1 Tax=Piscinibacter TaxID=1114981 RepID=UPI000FDDEFCB|nr:MULTISPECIES: hypothetical protein [Piscinibacter]MCW5665256.1 hypothetical protein [Piscinibacter sp.]